MVHTFGNPSRPYPVGELEELLGKLFGRIRVYVIAPIGLGITFEAPAVFEYHLDTGRSQSRKHVAQLRVFSHRHSSAKLSDGLIAERLPGEALDPGALPHQGGRNRKGHRELGGKRVFWRLVAKKTLPGLGL